MTALLCEAGDPLAHRWLFKRGTHGTETFVKNSGNSGGIQAKNGDATGSEDGSPTRALAPHPDRKIRKHQHHRHERKMNPGKISIISTNSMPTLVDIGGVAPGRPLQFGRAHSRDPNAMRPQFSTNKSGNNNPNCAGTAKPSNKGNGALAPVHPWSFKPRNTPLKNPSKTAVTAAQSRPGVAVQWAIENARPTHAPRLWPDRQV
jgi:hypothetical protein